MPWSKPTNLRQQIGGAGSRDNLRPVSARTIFGRIACEMRKYNVTLLVSGQHPSVTDDEVMSQLGTKVPCLLENERDIDSVLTGVAGSSELKSVLSKLEKKQQALLLGHAGGN